MNQPTPFPLIRASQMEPFILELERREIAPGPVLRESWAPLHPQQHQSAPLPETCLWTFIENCARHCGDQDFGIGVASRYGLRGTGAYGWELQHQPSLETALQLYVHGVSRHSSESRPGLFMKSGAAWLRRGTLPAKGRGFWQVEQYALGTLLTIIRSYTGKRWKPRTIKVQASRAVARNSALGDQCQTLVADAKFTEIEIPTASLENPPREYREKRAQGKRTTRPFPAGFAEGLTQVLENYVGDYPISLELASGTLGMHQRTVKRRLHADGCTFRSIREALLLRHARESLAQGGASLAEISAELGYTHTPHFCRAFKRMTGMSPGKYRAERTVQR